MSTRNQCLVGFHIMNTVTVTWNLKSMWEIDSGPTYVTNPGHSLLSTLSFLFFFVEGREPSNRAVKVRTRGIHYVGAETFDICAAFSPIKRHCMALIAECGTLRLYRVTVCNLGIVFPIMFVPCFICCFLLFFPKLVYNFQPKFVSETQPVRGWRHSHAFCKTTVTQDNG